MKTALVKLVSTLLIGLIAIPGDAVKSQQATRHFEEVEPPLVPGARIATAAVFLNGENRRNVEVYVRYSDNKNDLSSSNAPTGRASCKTISGGELKDNLSCKFIFPHKDHPKPNALFRLEIDGGEPLEDKNNRRFRSLIYNDSFRSNLLNNNAIVETDKNPKILSSSKTVFYQWVKEVVKGRSKNRFPDEIREFTMPRSLNIAIAGDSYTSGEGSPNRNLKRAERIGEVGPVPVSVVHYGIADDGKGMWNDNGGIATSCHRSRKSGQVEAVEEIIGTYPEVAVQYVNVSCSGAEIPDLIVDGQIITASGRRPYGKNSPPQISQVRNWLAEGDRKVLDIMLMTIGGNSIGFGPTATECLLNIFGECREDPGVLDVLKKSLKELPVSFSKLKEEIDANLVVKKVFLLEYPDPTKNSKGLTCDSSEIFEGAWGLERTVSREDLEFIHKDMIVPLNQITKRAALANGWTYLEGAMEKSRTHGLCVTNNPYFNTIGMSDAVQGDLFGSIHPTEEGHDKIYKPIVLEALEKHVCEVSDTCKKDPKAVARAAREAARAAAKERARQAVKDKAAAEEKRRDTAALEARRRKLLADPALKINATEKIEKIMLQRKPSQIKVKPVVVPNNDPDDVNEKKEALEEIKKIIQLKPSR